MSEINPNNLYQVLVKESQHPAKVHGLQVVNSICLERHEAKAMDWSVAAIGRLSEARGGPKASSLRQPGLRHYRSLIFAWAEFTRANIPRDKYKASGNADAWIDGIENIAARQLVYIMQKELQNAKAEIRRLQKIRPDGGLLKISARLIGGVEAVTGPSPHQVREVKRFVVGFVDNERFLRGKGLILKNEEIYEADSGEVVMGKAVSTLLRSIAASDGR